MTGSEMIMSSGRGLTFMYRVGGIAVHYGHLLVEHDVRHGFCFVPGGRVEYGENAVEALSRELREELGEEATIGRLIIVADNLFELDGDWYQEVSLYFLIEFAPDSKLLDIDGTFEGGESGTVFQWIPLAEIEQANLPPPFLHQHVREIPEYTEYIDHAEPGFHKKSGQAEETQR